MPLPSARCGGRCQRPGELQRDLEQQSAQPTPPPPPRLLALSFSFVSLMMLIAKTGKGETSIRISMEAAGTPRLIIHSTWPISTWMAEAEAD